jgi:hypothetical protein
MNVFGIAKSLGGKVMKKRMKKTTQTTKATWNDSRA